MGGDMERCETALRCYVGLMIVLKYPIVTTLHFHSLVPPALIRLISIRCRNECSKTYLQKQVSGLAIVFLSGDMKSREPDLALRIVFQQNADHLVVALLHRHSEWCKSILRNIIAVILTERSDLIREHLKGYNFLVKKKLYIAECVINQM